MPIGKISNILRERDFVWRIENFPSLCGRRNSCYESPSFSFAGETWKLIILPNGQERNDSVGYIDLSLYRESSGPPIRLDFSLILKTIDGEIEEWDDFCAVFDCRNDECGTTRLLKRVRFFDTLCERVRCDLRTVLIGICRMKYTGNTEEANETETDTCLNCKKNSGATNIPSPETKVSKEAIKCPVCFNNIKLKDWSEHECQKGRPEALEKLSHDLNEMMKSGENSDVVVKVKGKEFQLHRNILMTRCPYFHSKFKKNMRITDTVIIDDCEPEIFRILVHYLYTGKVDKLSSGNVSELYKTAIKYQVDELEKDCLDFMMETISEDSFFEFITFALKNDNKKLFEKCVDFLVSEPKDIIRSAQWQIFAEEYPTQADELIFKTMDHLA